MYCLATTLPELPVMPHASGGYDSLAAGEDLSQEREQAL